VLNYTPRCEEAKRSAGINTDVLNLVVDGGNKQFHPPAGLHPGRETKVPTG